MISHSVSLKVMDIQALWLRASWDKFIHLSKKQVQQKEIRRIIHVFIKVMSADNNDFRKSIKTLDLSDH